MVKMVSHEILYADIGRIHDKKRKPRKEDSSWDARSRGEIKTMREVFADPDLEEKVRKMSDKEWEEFLIERARAGIRSI